MNQKTPKTQIGIRVQDTDLEQIDHIIQEMELAQPYRNWSRSDVARMLIHQALQARAKAQEVQPAAEPTKPAE